MIAFPPAGEPGETLSTAKTGLAMNHDIMVDLSGIVKNLPIPPHEVASLGRRENLTGRIYGRLTVVSPAPKYKWLCLCSCGNSKDILAGGLKAGTVSSCGCLAKERATEINKTHGLHSSSIYGSWASMLTRCRNPNSRAYHNYGGRGITVDSRWLKFEDFYEDMGAGWAAGLSIDRIDNNKGYSKGNCVWATDEDQARNKRNSKLITYGGETKVLIEWCEILGLRYKTICERLRRGWTVEQAFELLTNSHRQKTIT